MPKSSDAGGPKRAGPPSEPRDEVSSELRAKGGGRPPDLGIETLRALVAGSEEGMVLTDGEGRILFANAACGRLVGVAPDDLVGRPGIELSRPDHQYMAREALAASLAAPGEAIVVALDIVQPDGGYRTLDVKVVNHLRSEGVDAIVAHFHEATSTAGEMGESYRTLFQRALVGLGVADMQGNLLAFNDAMLEPGGYTRGDIERLGNVANLFADPADRAHVLQTLRARGSVRREPVRVSVSAQGRIPLRHAAVAHAGLLPGQAVPVGDRRDGGGRSGLSLR
jgi:PAS domain S-box-containing protein